MFLPLFIAILLGLATPTNNNCSHNSGTVVTTNDTDPGNPGDPGDGGTDGDTGGENGHLPPPKIGD